MATPNPFDAPPPWREPQPDEQAARRLHAVHDSAEPEPGIDPAIDPGAPAPDAAPSAPNPFALGALPSYRGMDLSAAELAEPDAMRREPTAEQLAPHARPDPADDEPEQWRTPPAATASTATAADTGTADTAEPAEQQRQGDADERQGDGPDAVDGAQYDGDWGEWLGAVPEEGRAPIGHGPDAAELADRDYDEDDEWDIPDYDDPDYQPALVDRSGGRRGPVPVKVGRRAGGLTGALIGGVVVAALAAVVAAVVVVNLRHSDGGRQAPARSGAAAPPASAPASASPGAPAGWAHAADGCTRTRTAAVTIGADPGSTASGPEVILAFDWAYYVERSGSKARSFTTADAAVPAAEVIQRDGVDQQPPGARYCLHITPADGAGAWDVELHEQWPGEPVPEVTRQRVTTTSAPDGRTLITGMSLAPKK